MKTIKKILSLTILIVFLFNTMGYYFVFKVNQSILRSGIRESIQTGSLREQFLLIKIDHPASNPDFKKLDHDEFSYCGHLYDVVSESVKGNSTWYYCINDQHEEWLYAGLEKIQSFTSGTWSSDKTKQLQAFIHLVVPWALVSDPVGSVQPELATVNYWNFDEQPVNLSLNPVPPPPEFS